jgi:HSP20 family protein
MESFQNAWMLLVLRLPTHQLTGSASVHPNRLGGTKMHRLKSDEPTTNLRSNKWHSGCIQVQRGEFQARAWRLTAKKGSSMAESKLVKSTSEQPARRWPESSLFGPMIPFGDLFGVNPFALMREFTKEMDRAFSASSSGEFAPQAWIPAVEVKEVNSNLMVTAELPGIKNEEVTVEVTDQTLTIQGERKQEKKEEKEGVYRSERSYGRFYRSIPLPDGAKTDQIKAEMNNGILELKVPLAEAKQKTRQIPVSGSGAKEQEKKTTAA